MADFGVTPQGFKVKRLEDIRAEVESALRNKFGPSINLLPTEVIGQFVGIFCESQAVVWEKAEGTYNAFYPDTADGANLDEVVAITGIKRLEPTYSVGSEILYGTLGALVVAGSLISVAGSPTSRFKTVSDATIGAGTDEVQDVQFSSVPDAGQFTLVYDGEETALIDFSAVAADVQSALNNLPSLSGVTVAGDFTAGFTVTFSGADGEQPQNNLTVGQNTLLDGALAVVISVSETTPGVLPNVTVAIQAENKGAVAGFANSITVIETPAAGWTAANNPTDVTIGKDIETDAELRLRRKKTLATAGASTEEAIRARVLEIDEVTDARVFSNRTMFVDAFGRPPKSFETVVLGGEEQEIADVIWSQAPAGIEIYGNITKTVVDSQGISQTVKFSRPTPIDIYIDITLTVDSAAFPVNGDVAVQENIANYGDANFSIGDDVITTMLYCPIHDVQGILGITIDIGTAPNPVGDANIPIAEDEVSNFDTAFINVTVV